VPQVNPALGGKRPVDLLKRDRVAEMAEAARAYFVQPALATAATREAARRNVRFTFFVRSAILQTGLRGEV
jgi:hypothetical protein